MKTEIRSLLRFTHNALRLAIEQLMQILGLGLQNLKLNVFECGIVGGLRYVYKHISLMIMYNL